MLPVLVAAGLFLLLFVPVVALIVAFVVWRHRQERKRGEALAALARENGWRYIARDRHDRPTRHLGHPPFGQGHTRYAFNILAGSHDGVPFEVFDYHFAVTTQHGKSRSTRHHYYKVCLFAMPIAAPGLTIERERLHHKVLDRLGAEDIDFESDEFSRRFWVRCRDRRFAYDVIHPGMMEYLLAAPGWHWRWQGGELLVHGSGKLNRDQVGALLHLVAGFRQRVPRHLVAAVASAPRGPTG